MSKANPTETQTLPDGRSGCHSGLRRDVREAARGRARQIEAADDEPLQDRPVQQWGDNDLADAGRYVWSFRSLQQLFV